IHNSTPFHNSSLKVVDSVKSTLQTSPNHYISKTKFTQEIMDRQPGSQAPGGAGRAPVQSMSMFYLCAECGSKVSINKGETIRCKECGHRVLYKQRTKR